jgi:transposase
MTRRSYSKEYKHEAIRLAEVSGNMSQTARDLGIRAEMIRRWRLQFNDHGQRAFPGHGSPHDVEFAHLRRENKRLKEENIVLKKAAGILSRGLR